MEISRAEALALRMTSLLLDPHAGVPAPADVAGVVTWFGAMQAQDLGSGMWSLGARLPGSTYADIQQALERREALRTWPMRGTVHLVPPRDARWMIELMGGRPLAGAAKRREYLGLSEQTADRAVDVLGITLAGGVRLTRAQCVEALAAAGIDCAGQLAYHLLWYASQRGVTCIGPSIGKEQTFVLLDEWVPDPHRPDREEALATIAARYVRSHGPTTRQDFAGWTAMTAADAKRAIAAAGGAISTVHVEGREMLVGTEVLAASPAPGTSEDVLALPGFDEYLLGFKDRSLMLEPGHLDAIIPGRNGVFRPTVVRAGRVIGTWKPSVARGRTVVDVVPLLPIAAAERLQVEAALEPYARFTGRPLTVRWPDGGSPGASLQAARS